MTTYATLVSVVKLVHFLAVIFFLGNVALAPYRRRQARLTRNAQIVAGTYDGHAKSGRAITLPWLLVAVVTGAVLAQMLGYSFFRTGWLFWSITLTLVATVLFAAKLAPLQRQAADAALSYAALASTENQRRFESLAAKVEPVGRAAGILLYAILALMILKPALPTPW